MHPAGWLSRLCRATVHRFRKLRFPAGAGRDKFSPMFPEMAGMEEISDRAKANMARAADGVRRTFYRRI
jgi:hypothetical protein